MSFLELQVKKYLIILKNFYLETKCLKNMQKKNYLNSSFYFMSNSIRLIYDKFKKMDEQIPILNHINYIHVLEMQFDKFSKPRGIVVSFSFCITKGFQ